MTDLTTAIASAPDAPGALLAAIFAQAHHGAQQNLPVLALLAKNPSLPVEHLEDLAAGATSAKIRDGLLANPSTTLEQAQRWLTGWTKVQLSVWRTAVSHVDDPTGELATMALARHTGPWLYSEILTSDATSEDARIAAALALAATDKLKGSERDRIAAIATRTPGVAHQVHAVTGDDTLRTMMVDLADAQDRARGTGLPRRATTAQLQAWLAVAPDEQAALAALAGVTRTDQWRAAARTCRPGWDAMSAAIMTFVAQEHPRSWSNAASVAKAVLTNPSTARGDRVHAARIVASTGRGMTYDMRRAVMQVTTASDSREALARRCKDALLLCWLVRDSGTLSSRAKDHIATEIVATTWANRWQKTTVTRKLLADAGVCADTRDRLLASADDEGPAQLLAREHSELVLGLDWTNRNEFALVKDVSDTLGRACPAGALIAARDYLIGVAYADAVAAGPGLGALASLPVLALARTDAAHVGAIALRAVEHASAVCGGAAGDAAVLAVLDGIAGGGFTGTLGELATAVGASMAAA